MDIKYIETREEEQTKKVTSGERLAKLGFTLAADRLTKLAAKKRSMMIAYEHYRFVKAEKIAIFNNDLYNRTCRDEDGFKRLTFTSVENYQEYPPETVLASLETAIERKCFDSFEVAHIERVKDPILFGRIKECSDYFFIDQWDDDISIDQLLKANEG